MIQFCSGMIPSEARLRCHPVLCISGRCGDRDGRESKIEAENRIGSKTDIFNEADKVAGVFRTTSDHSEERRHLKELSDVVPVLLKRNFVAIDSRYTF